jgi:predicted MFS family arabinose efflux permease
MLASDKGQDISISCRNLVAELRGSANMATFGLVYMFVSKAARVFVFGMVSVMTPIYLAILGYSPVYVGIALMVIIAGNVFSNVVVTWYGNYFGRKRTLVLFSFLMFLSGVLLYSTLYFPLMLVALFVGNISTTGTEAGPFQSIETGVLPMLVGEERRSRAFGVYNFIGYGASSIGALAASLPAYLGDRILAFRSLYLLYGMVGLLLFAFYRQLSGIEVPVNGRKHRGLGDIVGKARRDIAKLSVFYSIDGFGGGFVSQSVLTYWFYLTYSVSLENLGSIFLITNVITAISTFAASIIAEKLGNLRTMVYSHLPSNVFLVLIPFTGSLIGALLFLFLRQSVSQMDVPTRQAFMAQIFNDEDRVSANAITNTFRSLSSVFGAPISGVALEIGFTSLPLLAGGFSKISYDLSIFASYRKQAK